MNSQFKYINGWWEGKNRMVYNLFCAISGGIGLMFLIIFDLPFNFFVIPFVMFYAILINLFYLINWVILYFVGKFKRIEITENINQVIYYLLILYLSIINILLPTLSLY